MLQMFFIDHTAKTTSFIDPRMPNDLPLLPADLAPPTLLMPNDPNATLLPPPPPRNHGASLTPPPSTMRNSSSGSGGSNGFTGNHAPPSKSEIMVLVGIFGIFLILFHVCKCQRQYKHVFEVPLTDYYATSGDLTKFHRISISQKTPHTFDT